MQNSFLNFIEYCKRSNEGSNSLQSFSLIWDEKYPSMIRRSLAMTLKSKLEQLPQNNELSELKALIEGLKDITPSIKNIEAKTDNLHRIFNIVKDEPIKKLSQKEQRELDLKNEIEAEKADIILQLNQK